MGTEGGLGRPAEKLVVLGSSLSRVWLRGSRCRASGWEGAEDGWSVALPLRAVSLRGSALWTFRQPTCLGILGGASVPNCTQRGPLAVVTLQFPGSLGQPSLQQPVPSS